MKTELLPNTIIRSSDPQAQGLQISVDGELVSLVEEAKVGPRGYAVVIRTDAQGKMATQNNKPVYKVLRGNVAAWREKKEAVVA
jgi:hypothetical protein